MSFALPLSPRIGKWIKMSIPLILATTFDDTPVDAFLAPGSGMAHVPEV